MCLDDILCGHELAVDLGFDSHDLASVHESLDVVLEPEHGWSLGCLVNPDSLEHTSTVVEGMTEDMDLCIFPVNDVSIEPNLLCFLHLYTFE